MSTEKAPSYDKLIIEGKPFNAIWLLWGSINYPDFVLSKKFKISTRESS